MARYAKPHITQRKTLLAVGEGKSDAAFLKYLRTQFCAGGSGVSVTVRQANGKGPSNVISTAIGALRISSYDKKLCLLDTDIDWTSQNKIDAKRSDADVAVLLRGSPGKFVATKLAMDDLAYDVLLDTGIRIQPLPVWESEWSQPENYSNPWLLKNIANEGIRL